MSSHTRYTMKSHRSRSVPFLVALSIVALSSHLMADTSWPGWRGATRDGKVRGAEWPAKLDESRLVQLWRTELSPSYSGPVIRDGKVWTTETVDKEYEVVRCYEIDTGKELWNSRWKGSMSVPFFARANGSWIRSTPALDGERLFVAGMRDVLVALDAEKGDVLWKVDFVEKFASSLPSFGFVCSPLVTKDALFVQAGASFLKLDKETGKVLWRTLEDSGGMQGSAFSSPVEATFDGQPSILVQTRTTLAAVDPEDGKVRWSEKIPAFRGMNVLTPSVRGRTVFTSTYGGGSVLLSIGPRSDETPIEVSTQWKNATQGYMSSPLSIDGHIYLHLRNQRMVCFDEATGEKAWTTRRRFGKYMSLVSREERVLGLDQKGQLLLLEANPKEFTLVDERKVSDEETWAHVAIVEMPEGAGHWIAIRELRGLAIWRWTESRRVPEVSGGTKSPQ